MTFQSKQMLHYISDFPLSFSTITNSRHKMSAIVSEFTLARSATAAPAATAAVLSAASPLLSCPLGSLWAVIALTGVSTTLTLVIAFRCVKAPRALFALAMLSSCVTLANLALHGVCLRPGLELVPSYISLAGQLGICLESAARAVKAFRASRKEELPRQHQDLAPAATGASSATTGYAGLPTSVARREVSRSSES